MLNYFLLTIFVTQWLDHSHKDQHPCASPGCPMSLHSVLRDWSWVWTQTFAKYAPACRGAARKALNLSCSFAPQRTGKSPLPPLIMKEILVSSHGLGWVCILCNLPLINILPLNSAPHRNWKKLENLSIRELKRNVGFPKTDRLVFKEV